MDFSNNSSQRQQVDVYCPVHHNWIGHYDYGSKGVYYCWCKKCKKEIKIVMENEEVDTKTREFL